MPLLPRPLAVAALLCAALPAVAQTTVPLDRTPRVITLQEAMAIAVGKPNNDDEVRIELRVVRVSGKECREALAKLCEKKPAMLTELELFTVLEKVAGERTTTVIQAPRLTIPAGQPGPVSLCDKATFTTAVTVKVVNGKTVFVPVTETVELGTKFTVTATPCKDDKSFELKLTYAEKQVDGSVPLLPVTTLIAPEFEVGSQGQPVPFTQFVQMPKFRELKLAEMVTVPDGSTVALHAGKAKTLKRNEFAPTLLTSIPYLDRMFKNVGIAEVDESVVVFASVGRVKAEPAKLIPAGAVVPATDPDLVTLLAEYRRACQLGKSDEARRLAVQALAKDPTCFGK